MSTETEGNEQPDTQSNHPDSPRKIFINYCHTDTADEALLLYEALAARFGPKNVFLDVKSLIVDEEWFNGIRRSGDRGGAFLVLIGDHWLETLQAWQAAKVKGADAPSEAQVFREIVWALRDWPGQVIPVLVGTPMPFFGKLPRSIRAIASKSAFTFRQTSFDADVGQLIETILRLTEEPPVTMAGAYLGPGAAWPPVDETAAPTGAPAQASATRSASDDPLPPTPPAPAPRNDRSQRPAVEFIRPMGEATNLPRAGDFRLRDGAWGRDKPPPPGAHFHDPFAEELVELSEAQRDHVIVANERVAARPWRERLKRSERSAGDIVSCSAFSPTELFLGTSALIQAFAHTSDTTSEVERMAKDADEDSTRRAIQTLESRIERESKLTFQLRAPGLHIWDGPQTRTWYGKPTGAQFEVEVPIDARLGTVIATLFVTQDSVPLGHIKFKITIKQSGSPQESIVAGDEARRYSKAFVSYASEDRSQVLARLQMLRPAHIEYFNDLLNLEPGERWERRLYEEIDRCDLFLLFWSNAARQSEWVRREVDYALKRKGGNDYSPPELWPVVIEGPPIAEPWEELSHLHLNDSLLYVMASSDPPIQT